MDFITDYLYSIDSTFIQNIGKASIIMLIAILSRPVFSKLILGWLSTYVKKTSNKLDDKIFDVMGAPIRFIAIVIAVYLIAEIYFPNLQGTISRTMVASCLFWGLYTAIDPLGNILVNSQRTIQKSLLSWALRVLRVIIVFIGVSAVLEIWGIEVGAILAGLGILGMAVALGTQDLFKNLIAGFLILSEKRFGEGEWINVEGVVQGTVEKIGLRSTLLRRFDQAPVQVPNSQLADAPLINFSRMPHRRIYWSIGLEYCTTTSQLQSVVQGIEKLIETDDFVSADKISTFVAVDKFNDSSIDILIYCFTHTNDWGKWLKIKQQLALDIKQLVENTGTGFAFPSQSIYIEKAGGFTPPVK